MKDDRRSSSLLPPSLYIDDHGPLDEQQLIFLHHGPTYVPPGQLQLVSSEFDRLIYQSRPLHRQLVRFFSAHQQERPGTAMVLEEKANHLFQQLFAASSSSPSSKDQSRAYAERELIRSIQRTLHQHGYFLRRTMDRWNRFYLGSIDQFQQQRDEYLKSSILFERFKQMDAKALHSSIDQFNAALATMHQEKHQINDEQRKKIRWPSLSFLPSISISTKGEETVRMLPFFSFRSTLIERLASFLNRLLRPLVDRARRSTVFYNSADFLRSFRAHVKSIDRIPLMMAFGTIELQHLHLHVTHEHIRDSLSAFLNRHLAPNRLDGLAMITIQQLIDLFLNALVVLDGNQLMRMRNGLPQDLPFSHLLMDIYLLHWQSPLLQQHTLKNEFFGRFEHTYFFTYHASDDRLHSFLKRMKKTDQADVLPFHWTTSQQISFLEMIIENRRGQLFTSIDRSTGEARYLLPYVVGHPTVIYAHYFQSLIIRAIRCCSDADDFDRERLQIECLYLLNGFPPLVVQEYIKRFNHCFQVDLCRLVHDPIGYRRCREQMFERIDQEISRYEQQHQWQCNGKFFRFTYLYEQGRRRDFNRQFQHLWTRYVGPYPMLADRSGRIHLNSRSFLSLDKLFLF